MEYFFEMPVAMGFAPGTEWLVVLTHDGLTVVDAKTGETLADEPGHSGNAEGECDPYPVSVVGIGPLIGQRIPVAGLWGGGLKAFTPDGWQVRRIAPNWPYEGMVLKVPCDRASSESVKDFLVVKDWGSLRAFGFSDSGQSLVVASEFLSLWTRD
ncbi:MAG: hypothetical protein R3A52_26720 [Polyangiales bacterium]